MMIKSCICDRLRGRDGKAKEPFSSISVDSRYRRSFSADQVLLIGLSPHFKSVMQCGELNSQV